MLQDLQLSSVCHGEIVLSYIPQKGLRDLPRSPSSGFEKLPYLA